MKPWTNALYVSLISRCDSAAIVPNTSELLPEPDTPVNTVSRRFGISTLMSLRLFSRAPRTRIRSWVSAVGIARRYQRVRRAAPRPADIARTTATLDSGASATSGVLRASMPTGVGRAALGRGP